MICLATWNRGDGVALIPGFLLKKLYVRRSLRNTAAGCALDLRNVVDSATVTRFLELEVDGRAYWPERLVVVLHGHPALPATAITPQAPITLPAGTALSLLLPGVALEPGSHHLRLRFQVLEVGELAFHVEDRLSERQAEGPTAGCYNVAEEEKPMQTLSPAANARPPRIAILGAGSTVFARQLMTDLLCTPGLESGAFALVDVDAERLDLARNIAARLVEASGRDWKVEASTERDEMLPGCDYVISLIEVAGLRNVVPDYEIPLKYGVDQCIGDTIGPGGIFKMLRTGPAWLDILADVEKLCPRALVMSYTNPMSALTLLALRASHCQVVGLCHSVQGTSRQLAGYLDVPLEEMTFRCGGINHMAWFVELTHRGEDLYPRLRAAAQVPEIYDCDPVRFEMMLHFGAFVTESSGHFSEYVPYFRKRPDLIARYMREGYRGASGFYARNWPAWRREAEETVRAQLAGQSPIVLQRSTEYAADIVEAMESGRPAVIHGNVRNDGLISSLPAGGCVEVPVLVDRTGLHPTTFGPLPPQLAALAAAHMYVHELMVQAVEERDRAAARQALMLDPLTAAVLAPAEIAALFDEMWAAEEEDLRAYA
jgi:alpha-galactosidase